MRVITNIHQFRTAKLELIRKYGTTLLEGGGDRAEELQQDIKPLADYAGIRPAKVLAGLAAAMKEAAP